MTDIAIWKPAGTAIVPKSARTAKEIATHARQLNEREKKQVISAFESEHFEMGAVFLWNRSMAGLKKRLSHLGTDFVGEMLNRPDIGTNASLDKTITDYEAVRLAEELGMFSSTQAMRLKHAMELVSHFSQPPQLDDDPDDEMMPEEAVTVFRACVQSILGHEQLDSAMEFVRFRAQLEERSFREDDTEIAALASSPSFFQNTTIRVLMALAKTSHSAQLEHVIGNMNIIVPALWRELSKPVKWLVGQTYAELHAAGQRTAAKGVRQALLKVRGFDYVPEDLRSRTFILAARKVEEAHNGRNNFYNEPAPMKALARLGTVIPMPAFPHCMSATLAVKIGNVYGVSWAAQEAADAVLRSVTPDRWSYYLDHCLPLDKSILLKLTQQRPGDRWARDVVNAHSLDTIDMSKRIVQRLVEASTRSDFNVVKTLALRMYRQATNSSD